MVKTPLIETKELKKHFNTPYGKLHAVDGINVKIEEGQTLGIVGESGCGKSTLGRTMIRLNGATSGEVLYRGENILDYNKQQIKVMRKNIQIIFQDPYASLNPRWSVSEIIGEPFRVNKVFSNKKELNNRVAQLMDTMGLAKRLVNTYPHELDGGRRQRIGIARALALNPEFIICDEPVSSLDVSIQAQILNLLMDLQDEMGLTYMFITHDLSVVKHISTNIAVMYLGQCVELAPSKELFKNPKHPYTKALMSAIPIPELESRNKKMEIIKGEISSPINPKPGCRFAPRCPYVNDSCTGVDILLKMVDANHEVACTLY